MAEDAGFRALERPAVGGGATGARQRRARGREGAGSSGAQPDASSTRSDAQAIQLPGRLDARASELFVNRARELAAAARTVDQAGSGKAAVICFEGEPGIGKTCLAAQIAAAAHERGVVVLYGRCDEQAGVPYQPFVEALDHYVEHTPSDQLEAHLAGLHAVWRILPRLGSVPQDLAGSRTRAESGAERFLLCAEVASLVTSIASDRPVVLVLDDLHWADESSVLMTRQLLERTDGARLVTVLMWRGTDVGDEHPLHSLLADIAHSSHAERFQLSGLGRDEVVECVGEEIVDAGASAQRDIALSVLDRSAGNPLFVRELLRDIAERTNAGATLDGTGGAGLPESIREVVRDRVTRLGPGVREVLEAAACVGAAFDVRRLEECVDPVADDVAGALDAARAAGLLSETGDWAGALGFVHVLVQDALYEMRRSEERRVGKECRL